MSETIIEVENISKQYRIGNIGSGSLRNDLQRWWSMLRGKGDPFEKVGDENNRTITGGSEYVWALKDINFTVKRGEVVGIIGANGAGKSTLLKILAQITGPSTGKIKVNGRIASLLEVGTGFHPELTGRENVMLNGAILGMSKQEIRSKFDEIVEFSGCQRYIDTPVKRYSSGMRVRLAFAIAAHLEPEILIIDEVLAVGDKDFQQKAIGKMKDVTDNEGRTVLFVSHNMSSIKNLCTRGIVLENGNITQDGDVNEVIEKYLSLGSLSSKYQPVCTFPEDNNMEMQVRKLVLRDVEKGPRLMYSRQSQIQLDIEFDINKPGRDYYALVIVKDISGNQIYNTADDDTNQSQLVGLAQGKYQYSLNLYSASFKPGHYFTTVSFTSRAIKGAIDKKEDVFMFDIVDVDSYRGMKNKYRPMAVIAPEIEWKLNKLPVKTQHDD